MAVEAIQDNPISSILSKVAKVASILARDRDRVKAMVMEGAHTDSKGPVPTDSDALKHSFMCFTHEDTQTFEVYSTAT
jgi:hypothetical protein